MRIYLQGIEDKWGTGNEGEKCKTDCLDQWDPGSFMCDSGLYMYVFVFIIYQGVS